MLKSIEERQTNYTEYCNQCFCRLPEDPVMIVDECDDDRCWYEYYCSETCMKASVTANLVNLTICS